MNLTLFLESDPKVVSESGRPALSYRPEIDGLRALAVLAVVFHHAELGFSGGYVGVDVFFVISGYLITSLLLRDLERGTFSFPGFWERRVRRIFPALNVMVVATFIAGWCLLPPGAFAQLGKSIIAQALMAANIYFYFTTSYFGQSSSEIPLLHTWSLAIEEQFYFFLPVILWLIYRFIRSHKQRVALWMIGSGFIMSLALASVLIAFGKISPTFYTLPTRAWELLGGALVAALPWRYYSHHRGLRETASWFGLACILVPVFLYTKHTIFPGIAALPVCLGAMLLIWSNQNRRSGEDGKTTLGHLLTWRPLVFIGLISYSLYLWHWPLLVYARYWSIETLSPSFRWGLVLVSMVLAILSWRFVEQPFRRKSEEKRREERRAILSLAIGTHSTLVALGLAMMATQGFPFRMPDSIDPYEKGKRDTGPLPLPTVADVRAGRLYSFGDTREGHPPELLVWGDSHAMHLLTPLDDLCQEYGIAAVAATGGLLPPILDSKFGDIRIDFICPDFSAAVIDYVRQHSIRYVVLAGLWSSYQKINNEAFEKGLQNTLRALEEQGCKVWVVMGIPTHSFKVPLYLMKRVLWPDDTPKKVFSIQAHRERNRTMYRLAENNLSAYFVDPLPAFIDKKTGEFFYEKDGVSIYRDSDHLSAEGARKVMLPILRQALEGELRKRE